MLFKVSSFFMLLRLNKMKPTFGKLKGKSKRRANCTPLAFLRMVKD